MVNTRQPTLVLVSATVALWLGVTIPQAADLIDYKVKDDTIPRPLTKIPGDPVAGRAIYVDRDRGHCLLCHAVSSLNETFHGTIGPDLSDVGNRLSPEQLRMQIVDSTRLNRETVMPAYYRVESLTQVAEEFQDKPVLTAQEVEDLVAFLSTLKEE